MMNKTSTSFIGIISNVYHMDNSKYVSKQKQVSKCNDGSCPTCYPLNRKLAKVLSKLDYYDTSTLLVNLTAPVQHKISGSLEHVKDRELEKANNNIGKIIAHLQIQLVDRRSEAKKTSS